MARGVLLAILLVIATAVAAGPYGLGTEQPSAVEDSANVSVQSVPTESVVLTRGQFGSGSYHVESQPVVVTVADVTGEPTLRYAIDIPAAGLVVTSRYDLSGREGELRMGPGPTTISPEYIDQGSYDALIAIWLRTGIRERSLTRHRITIEVQP